MTHPPRMRPTFALLLHEDAGAIYDRLASMLDAPDSEVEGQVHFPRAFLRIRGGRRPILSPHLDLDLRIDGEQVFLHGRFSPRPNVWMGFMALFFLIGMVGLVGLVFGLAQLMLGGPFWTIWAAPVSAALIGFIYGAAFIGQGLSSEEMYRLRAFVEASVRESSLNS